MARPAVLGLQFGNSDRAMPRREKISRVRNGLDLQTGLAEAWCYAALGASGLAVIVQFLSRWLTN